MLWAVGGPVEIVEVELRPPAPGEVLIRIAACGVCASDLHVVDGHLPRPLPIVLGHEAAGTVVETAPDVDQPQAGDRVVLSLAQPCGGCEACVRGR